MKIFIIFLLNIHIFKTYLILPFRKEKKSFTNLTDFIFETLNSHFLTNIQIGEPFQMIPFNLVFHQFIYYISNHPTNKIYNINKSSSFKELNKTKFSDKYINTGYICNETFNFNINNKNKTIKDFNFFLVEKFEFKQKNFPASIGLGTKGYYSKLNENFIYQLKLSNIINSYIFSIQFINEDEGEIIIGELLHEVKKKDFKNYNFAYTYIDNQLLQYEWGTKFENISIGNYSVYSYYYIVIFNLNLKGIIAENQFLFRMGNIFFKELILVKKCKKDIISLGKDEYYFFHCDKNIKIDYSKLDNIYLKHKYLNMTFIIEQKDLFEIYNDRIIYLVFSCINVECDRNWVLGEQFIKKYPMSFNNDRKLFGIYQKNLIINKKFEFTYVLILLLLIIIIILITFFSKYFKINRKIRVNELYEEFLYIPKE